MPMYCSFFCRRTYFEPHLKQFKENYWGTVIIILYLNLFLHRNLYNKSKFSLANLFKQLASGIQLQILFSKCQVPYLIGGLDWSISEIQFKYEKLKFYDLLNESMELVFQKNSKMGHLKAPEIHAIFSNLHHIFANFDNIF